MGRELLPYDAMTFRRAYEGGRERQSRRNAATAAERGDYEGAAQQVMEYDPGAAQAYEGYGQRQDQRAFDQSYTPAIANNDFAGAETIAAKHGNLQGVQAARQGAQQFTQQQREEALRDLQGYADAFDQVAASPDDAQRQQGYAQLLQRARDAARASPELAAVLNRFPNQWTPQVHQMIQGTIQTWRDRLLSPEQQATLEDRRADNARADQALTYQDRRADAAERMADAAMRRAEAAAGNQNAGGLSTQQFQRANSLRDEYNNQTKDYRGIANIVQRSLAYANEIATGRAQPNSQSDIGLVYALAKVYDPTSVVREGEFATVARSGGLGPQIQGYVNRIVSDGRLPDAIRNGIVHSLRQTYDSQRTQYEQVRSRYQNLATRSGIDPMFVIDDYTAPAEASAGDGSGGDVASPAPVRVNTPADAQRLAPGTHYVTPDGHEYVR